MHHKTAIIHEWLVNYAGSERVLEQIVSLIPDADIFCQVDFRQVVSFARDPPGTDSIDCSLPSRKSPM